MPYSKWSTMNTTGFAAILAISLLAGCSGYAVQHDGDVQPSPSKRSQQQELSFDDGHFGPAQAVIPVEEIYRLSNTQETAFREYFEHPGRQDIPPHQRVWYYLQEITMDFHYQGETYDAGEALERSSGNCLSLAILTTALARLAGVETAYQLVESEPVFESHGSVVFKARHVRTMLFQPEDEGESGKYVLRRGGLLVDYFPTTGSRFVSNISENQYAVMYYNNLAGEAIAGEDYNRAFWLLKKSLELEPDNAGTINAMAILYRRTGDLAKAEEIYKYGIERLDQKVSLLRNYRVLLEQTGRDEEVKAINSRLARLDDPSPFDWLHSGDSAYLDGAFSDAVFFYRKAADIAPYLHESYAGMAKAYYMMGQRKDAEREFKHALQYSQRSSTRSMYEAKLVALGIHP